MSKTPLILSIRQPWAWAILHGGKDIENRTWSTRVRGRILIHAGVKFEHDCEDHIRGIMRETGVSLVDEETGEALTMDYELGGIVGSVEIVDCIDATDFRARSPWFCGPYGFVLRNPRVLPFKPMRGRLGFFREDRGSMPPSPESLASRPAYPLLCDEMFPFRNKQEG